jgi:perosamine synthetase
MIPLAKPFLGAEEKKIVLKILKSDELAYGNEIQLFEERLQQFCERKYCLTVNSGTTALYIALKALKLKKYVILPALTCETVLYAVLQAGLTPIFADISEDTHNINIHSIPEEFVKKSEALIIIHAYGSSAENDEIIDFASKNKLKIIEDFSQSFGGQYKNKPLGSFGNISITSFYATKIMTTGHGGAILTDDKQLNNRVYSTTRPRATSYYPDLIPQNTQMTNLQAAIGLIQLGKMSEIIQKRRKAAQTYDHLLKKQIFKIVNLTDHINSVFYKYVVELPENCSREFIINSMKKQKIDIGSLYYPLYQNYFMSNHEGLNKNCPISEAKSKISISLPMYSSITKKEITTVTDNLIELILN